MTGHCQDTVPSQWLTLQPTVSGPCSVSWLGSGPQQDPSPVTKPRDPG